MKEEIPFLGLDPQLVFDLSGHGSQTQIWVDKIK